jgi:hypothetical protein
LDDQAEGRLVLCSSLYASGVNHDHLDLVQVTNSLRDVGVSIKELVGLADNMHT